MIKSVLFDFDGVLADSLESNIKFYQGVIRSIGLPEQSREIVAKHEYLTFIEALRSIFPDINEEKIKDAIEVAKSDYEKYIKYIKINDGVQKSLSKLSQKFILGIVTGRLKFDLIPVLSHLGIEKFFDVLMTAEKYSKPKPNPEPLLLALKKLNLKPDQVVYIGDTQIDADAAKAAGITFIHYGKKNVNGYDHHIDYFNELLPILEQM